MEPGSADLQLELAEAIETSQKALFELDNVLAALSSTIRDTLGFEFVAIQLFHKDDRTIETVHATGSQQGLIGLAKHPIDGDDEILDIQASIFNADPPKIKLISGWDSHFDKLIYEQFNHALVVRAWVPIIVLKRGDGSIISDWPRVKPWRYLTAHDTPTETIDGNKFTRFNIDITLDKAPIAVKHGDVFIEKLGTVEAGHCRLVEGIAPETAISLSDLVATRAISGVSRSSRRPSLTGHLPSLREASLDNVLETTAKSAMRMLGGKAATLHCCYDQLRNKYIYETASGVIGPEFIAHHPPRKEGLGRQAIIENRTIGCT